MLEVLASRTPISPVLPSQSAMLQSVVQVLSFRKRPSETHSGLGLKTPTDAVKVVHLQHPVHSRPVQARISARPSFATSTFLFCCAQRILCELSFVLSLSLSLAVSAASFRHSETKPQTSNDSSKETPSLHLTKAHKGCLVLW